jgi:hypothetical protein
MKRRMKLKQKPEYFFHETQVGWKSGFLWAFA